MLQNMVLHFNISTRTTYGIQAWQKASRSHAASLQAMVTGRAHTVRAWGGGKIRAVRKLEKQRAYKGAVTCMGCVLAARLQTQLARTLAVTHAAHAPRVLTKVWTAAQVG